MSRHKPNKAEFDFFKAITSESLLKKEAVELEPETSELLGVQSVSPSILDSLESSATAPAEAPQEEQEEDAPPPEPEASTYEPSPTEYMEDPEPPPDEGVEVGGFEREDVPPVPEDGAEEVAEPELPTRATHGRLFSDKRAHPLQLFDVLNMRYKAKWTTWEPETLWWALRRDFGPVGDLVRNKIGALILAATTDVPWLDWDVFEDCGLAWNDVVPLFGAFQPMTPMQMAFTVQVLRGIRPEEEFAHEVKAYMAAILDEHGFAYAPEEWFDGAQQLLDRKPWIVGFKTEVMDAWERIQGVAPEEIEWRNDRPLDIHLVRLSVTKRYLEERAALREVVPGVSRTSTTTSPPVP